MSLINRIGAELRGDRVIWMIVAVLALLSILTVYSSAGTLAFRERGDNTEFYLVKQVLILSFGLFLTYMFYIIHYQKYSIAAPYALMVMIPLLAFTLFFWQKCQSCDALVERAGYWHHVSNLRFSKIGDYNIRCTYDFCSTRRY
jgi:cell division protein FtsW (lipid II flippase)